MIDRQTLERLQERALSDFDLRDLLAEHDRLQAELTSRANIDPTGGISDAERLERRRAAYQPHG